MCAGLSQRRPLTSGAGSARTINLCYRMCVRVSVAVLP